MKKRIARRLLRYLPGPLVVALKMRHYVRSLRTMGPRDEQDLAVVGVLVGPGDYAVDVGANIGLYTKALSEAVGTGGRVYSMEPVPVTYRLLAHCVRRLRLDNVLILDSAVSDARGTARMTVPDYHDGGKNYYMARLSDAATKASAAFDVPTDTLDSILSHAIDRISFVKCDVEGHEWRVVQGAKKLVRESSPAWLIELSDDPDTNGSSAWSLVRYMEKSGYRCYWYDGECLRRRRPSDHSVNYFFLKPAHLIRLREAGIPLLG